MNLLDLVRIKAESPTDSGPGRALWDRVFGQTKEEPAEKRPVRGASAPGGSWGRSSLSSDASFKRLLQAMRSMAPGGWSDDRWNQTINAFYGVPYVAIHRICTQLSQAEFQVSVKDDDHPDGKRPIKKGHPGWDLVKLLEKPNNQDSFGKLLYRLCFPAGTKIRMADGSQKNIEQVRLLDEVLTAEGRVGKVNQCHVRDCEEGLAVVSLWGYSHLKMTPEHPVLTERGYVPAGKLEVDDWVAIPRYKPQESKILQTANHVVGEVKAINGRRKSKVGQFVPSTGGTPWPGGYKKVPDFLELTPGLGRILGLFLAEGHTTKAGRVCWSFNITEMDTLVAELVQLLKEELGLTATVKVMNERGTVALVYVGGKLWQRLFESLCGKWAHGKRAHPDLLCGPDGFLNGLLTGWVDGDGCERRNERVGATVSHELALNMFDIANYLGFCPIMHRNAAKRGNDGIVRRPGWKVAFGLQAANGGGHRGEAYEEAMRLRREKGLGALKISRIVGVHRQVIEGWFRGTRPTRSALKDGKMWRRVRKVQLEGYSGKVFNIGVEGDNSYVAEGIGVHNCQQKYLTGSWLLWMVPNRLGVPMELYVVPTATAIPQPAINPDYPDGFWRIQPVYPYGPFSSYPTPASAVGAAIPAQWMIRGMWPHPLLRYDGYSPSTGLNMEIDEFRQMGRSRWYSMKRSINPSAVMNFDDMETWSPLPVEEIARIHAEWEANFQGTENHGNLIVGTPGSKIEPWGQAPKDMDYPNGWNQLSEFLFGGYGTNKPSVGMADAASYANFWAAMKQLYWVSLDPECNDTASELTRHLAPFFGDDLVIEIRCRPINDWEQNQSKITAGTSAKCITKNETRKMMDLPVTGEEWGEEIAGMDSKEMIERQKEAQAPPPGAGGMPGAEGGAPGQPGQEQANGRPVPPDLSGVQDRPIPPDLGERPTPGGLGEGSLGPRTKRFTVPRRQGRKSLYDQLIKALSNGNGSH